MKKILLSMLLVSLWSSLTIAQNNPLNQADTSKRKLILEDLFFTHKIPNGYSWTIASRLGRILSTAIDRFGPRNGDYTILGVEFSTDNERPQVWFPSGKYIVIQLGSSATKNAKQAYYQLTHEVIHCLSPTGVADANVLEEGIATCFSEDYMSSNFNEYWHDNLPEYKNAYTLVRQLLAIDNDIIKRLRKVEFTISKITPQQIVDANPAVPIELANALCKKF